MQYPNMSMYTIDCDCDDIVFQINIQFDKDDHQSVDIKASELLPFLGQVVSMQMAHRSELRESQDKSKEVSEIENILGGSITSDA